jgi:enoyl-CoA hydratase/carnithine racemase
MDAEEAEYLGLLNTVVPADELDETVNRLAKGLSLMHPDALAVGKDAINAVMEARGVLKAQDFTNYMQVLWQERDIDPGAFKFFEARDEKGLKAALMERDAPFKDFP